MFSIVIPAYNEARALEGVLREVRQSLEGFPHEWEIIVVDDASTDDTGEIASRNGARLIRHPYNMGGGAARKTGIEGALHPVVAVMDADGTYPARCLSELFHVLVSQDARMVVGARNREAGTVPWLRAPVKDALRRFASLLVRAPIEDLNSGMRIFRKEDVLKVAHLLPPGHSWVTTITLVYQLLGWSVGWCPIGYRPRVGRSTFHPVVDTFRCWVQIVRSITYLNPLRLYIPLFLGFGATGAALAVRDLFSHGTLEESDVILFFLSALSLALGMMADSVAAGHRRSLR